MNEIVIVALKMKREDPNFYQYLNLSVSEKIDFIENHIMALCKILEKKHPNSLWIFVWREYGISTDKRNRAITNDDKKYLKTRMQSLTEKFQNLVIISGTVSFYKNTALLSKLVQVRDQYHHADFVESIKKEELRNNEKDEQIKVHLLELEEALNMLTYKGINILRNTCYVFQNNTVQRHDKLTPFEETSFNEKLVNAVFQLSKGRNLNPYFYINIPGTDKKILISVNLCRECQFEITKMLLPEMPLIQFVLSDSTDLRLKHLYAKYTIQCDSFIQLNLIVNHSSEITNNQITLYENNLYAGQKDLIDISQPLYPFEAKVIDLINDAINYYSRRSRNLKERFRKELQLFIENINSETIENENSYEYIEELLNRVGEIKTFLGKRQSAGSFLVKQDSYISNWINKLKHMLTEEQLKYPERDISSSEELLFARSVSFRKLQS